MDRESVATVGNKEWPDVVMAEFLLGGSGWQTKKAGKEQSMSRVSLELPAAKCNVDSINTPLPGR